MKFFVSDTEKLDNKFSKWYYWTDKKCKIFKNNERLVIYNGYTIEKSLDEYVQTDPHLLEHANGKYCAVILEKNYVKVIVDYFCQTKIFYRHTNRFEVTNQVYLFPFTTGDIDAGEIIKRCRIPKEFKKYATIRNWCDWSNNGNLPEGQYNHIKCKTVFKNTFVLQPDHLLLFDGKLNIKRIHDVEEKMVSRLNQKIPTFRTSIEAEDYIHKCMEDHADVIKKNYNNIVSTISEGIDSCLQDQYFPNSKRLMYHYKNPETGPINYKENIINEYKLKNIDIQLDTLDLSNLTNIALDVVNDPNLFWCDTLPTIWQLNNLDNKPDLFMYGQNGDQMFMHKPSLLYPYLFSRQINTSKTPEQVLEESKNCYGSTRNLWSFKGTRNAHGGWEIDREFVSEGNTYDYDYWLGYIKQHKGKDLGEWFSSKCLPDFYIREISHNTDIEGASIYADKRIFFIVYGMSNEVRLDNMRHVSIQKNILKRKFNTDFKTRFKDEAGFNIYDMVKPMVLKTIEYCLKAHLPKA